MDDLKLIAEVLCRLDLPDREVYPAMARLRDHPTPEARDDLLERFAACVCLGLDLPLGGDHWEKLADHPRFSIPDLYNHALRERVSKVPKSVPLYDLLKEAAARLHLREPRLMQLLQELRCAPRERVEQLLLPAFFKAARQRLGLKPNWSAWLALRDRPEFQDLPEFRSLVEFLAGQEVGRTAGCPLWDVKKVAYQIQRLLSDNPIPPDFGDDGGEGIPSRPRDPKPGQPGQRRLDQSVD